MSDRKFLVSIYCLTYNHEKYIRQTLEGFLSQNLEGAYEVIIHDDASTDGTRAIIEEYQRKFPDFIRVIAQEHNQFSQNVDIIKTFVLPNVRGEYVAVCEGDDYWCDAQKLQKQIAVMQQHGDCNLCVHRTKEIFEDGKDTGVLYPQGDFCSGPVESEVLYSSRYSFHTSSFMFRADAWKEYLTNPPLFQLACDVGDEACLLYFGLSNGIYYLNEIMSCYRRGVVSSWSALQARKTAIEDMVQHPNAMVKTYRLFDEYTTGKYHRIMNQKTAIFMLQSNTLQKKNRLFFKKENKQYYSALSFKYKLFVLLSCLFPRTMQKYYLKRINRLKYKMGYQK